MMIAVPFLLQHTPVSRNLGHRTQNTEPCLLVLLALSGVEGTVAKSPTYPLASPGVGKREGYVLSANTITRTCTRAWP